MHRVLLELLDTVKAYHGIRGHIEGHVGNVFANREAPMELDAVLEKLEDVHVPKMKGVTLSNLMDHLRAVNRFRNAQEFLEAWKAKKPQLDGAFAIPKTVQKQSYRAWYDAMDRLREKYEKEKSPELLQLHQKLKTLEETT